MRQGYLDLKKEKKKKEGEREKLDKQVGKTKKEYIGVLPSKKKKEKKENFQSPARTELPTGMVQKKIDCHFF